MSVATKVTVKYTKNPKEIAPEDQWKVEYKRLTRRFQSLHDLELILATVYGKVPVRKAIATRWMDLMFLADEEAWFKVWHSAMKLAHRNSVEDLEERIWDLQDMTKLAEVVVAVVHHSQFNDYVKTFSDLETYVY